MRLFGIFIVALFFPSVAFAQDALRKDIAQCAILAGALERLDCYDNIAKNNNLTVEQTQDHNTTSKGEWDVDIEINPIDDSKTVVLSVKSSSGVSFFGTPGAFVLRCKSNETDAYINWGNLLGRRAFVVSRIGKEEAKRKEWHLSTNRKSSFHPTPVSFIKNMIGHDILVAQIAPLGKSPITTTFNISGLENAVVPLREACGW